MAAPLNLCFLTAAVTVLCVASSSLAGERSRRIPWRELTTSKDRIVSYGYPAESHYVETSDGYILNVFRIPYSPKLQNQKQHRPVVLLQHGLLSNSDSWLASGPENALAYNLVDAGYDVWLGNARGNLYSRSNSKISVNNPKFWQFSWHEIAVLDIPTIIDYISQQTNEESMHYVGHSQGTTVFFVLMSERPEYNARIKSAHMLAPCAYLSHGTHVIFKALAPLVGRPGGLMASALRDMELLPQNPLINRLADTYCGLQTAYTPFCRNFYVWLTGSGFVNMNRTALQVLVETHPGGGSTNQGIHFIQVHVSQQFRQFDYGVKRNRQLYNQPTPPEYDLSKVSAPTYLYSSANDVLCVPADVDDLVAKLPKSVDDYRIPDPTWNHLDFIAATQIKEVINDRVVEIANRHERKTQK